MAERALNVFWIALGLATCAYARSLGLTGPGGPDSGLFPFIAGASIAGGGLWLLVRGRRAAAVDVAWPRGAALVRVLVVTGGLVVMTLALPRIGFVAAAIVTMAVLLRAIERTRWIEVAVLAIVSSVAVWWLFARVLAVPLPQGPWGF
jgi:hypothetical protein